MKAKYFIAILIGISLLASVANAQQIHGIAQTYIEKVGSCATGIVNYIKSISIINALEMKIYSVGSSLPTFVKVMVGICFVSILPIMFLLPLTLILNLRGKGVKLQSEVMKYINILTAFAAGGIIGDVLLHLLPHLMIKIAEKTASKPGAHGHIDHTAFLVPFVFVFGGFISFFVFEKTFQSLEGKHRHSGMKEDEEHEIWSHNSLIHLIGDTLSNLSTGFFIGAAFSYSNGLGVVTTLAMMSAEIPHEIGDFAVLVRKGAPITMAITLQAFGATGAIVGGIAGILCGDIWVEEIMSFTTGGLLYLAFCSLIPELLEHHCDLNQSLKLIFGILAGWTLMLFLCFFEG